MHPISAVYIGIIVAGAILLFRASESWWSVQEQGRFKERIAELWAALSESQGGSLLRNFLLIISSILDRFYGEKVFSIRSFFRVQLTTAVIYAVALAVIGLRAGVPFSMKNPPWQGFDYSFELVETFFNVVQQTLKEETAKTDKVLPPYQNSQDKAFKKWIETWTMEQTSKEDQLEKSEKAHALIKEISERWWTKIKSYRTQEFRTLHSILCLGFATFLCGFEAFLGFAICRKLLRDLTVLRTLSNAFAVITCAGLLFAVLHATTIILLTLAAIPITLSGAALIFSAFWYVSAWLGFLLLLAAIWVLQLFAPLWIKVAASVSVLPIALVTLAAIVVVLLNWFGWPLKRAAVAILDRSLRAEKGPVTFFTSLVILIASLLGLFLSR